MTVQAQAGSVQATTARSGALLAVFVFLVALFVGLVGLAIAFRPAVAAPTSDATWSQTHPLMVDRATAPVILDRGADSFSGATSTSDTKVWLQTHPLMVDRATTPVILDRGADSFNGALDSSNVWQQSHPLMADRGTAAATDMSSAARAALSSALAASTAYQQTHPVMADRAVALATSPAYQSSHDGRAPNFAVSVVGIPNISAATGFNLSVADATDMSAAARAAINSAISTPAISPYTGFNLSAAGSPQIIDRGADR